MGRKLEWELSGKSDVPAKMAEAKKSMEGVDGAANALGKKFKEAFKDIAVGFIAPMVLVQKAIGFIADRIEQAKQKAKEASDFAKEEESKKYAAPGARESLLQYQEKKKEEENRKKSELLSYQGYVAFLSKDPRGVKMLEEEAKKNFFTRKEFESGQLVNAARTVIQARGGEEVKRRIDEIMKPEVAARQLKEDLAKQGNTGDTAQKISELSSNVVGVGMSPQLDALNKQISLQEDMANSLRVLIERDAQQAGFTPNKFWPSARRLNLPR